MIMNRRTLMTSASAALLAPIPAYAATSGTRTFRVTRDGSDIGTHRISVTREGDLIKARTDINIAVTVLGFTAYRYELAYDEVYKDGQLQSLDGKCNDDGDAGFVQATRSGDALTITGSSYTGPVASNAVPTSYWRMDGLQSTPWISAQSGEPLQVGITETASRTAPPAGSRIWRAYDGAEYDVEIWYDAAGDWVGCAFDAGGELGEYTLMPGSDSLIGLSR